MMRILIPAICFCVLSFGRTQAQSPVIADNAELIQVASGYTFTEGPAVDHEGSVFFTDQPNDKIYKWSTDGTVTLFMEGARRSNGLYFDNQGYLLSCADLNNQLVRINPDKSIDVLVKDFQGHRLNGPNDLWVDPRGGVYFTDPFYKRPWWNEEVQELKSKRVYYLSPKGGTIGIVAEGFDQPNGIIGTPNGKILYVSDIRDGKTYSFDIGKNGALSNKRLFIEKGSDGMTIDEKGNIYITGDGVTVFDPSGRQIEHIEVDQKWTANVVFGGKEQKTLFITAMGSVYTLEMQVKGVRSFK